MSTRTTILLTCVDARIDPAVHFSSLELDHPIVLRNPGGRVNPAVLRDIGVLCFLTSIRPGGAGTKIELVIVQHTQCGLERLGDPTAQQALADKLEIKVSEVAAMALTDPAESLRTDIELLRRASKALGILVVSGHAYDLATESLTEIVPRTPLCPRTS